VDKNFDGEQQPSEPGVPNAVIYLDDGNRITTDTNGLYSLNFVLPGTHTGTLDLTSLPGAIQSRPICTGLRKIARPGWCKWPQAAP
jgi:hypothetical protein